VFSEKRFDFCGLFFSFFPTFPHFSPLPLHYRSKKGRFQGFQTFPGITVRLQAKHLFVLKGIGVAIARRGSPCGKLRLQTGRKCTQERASPFWWGI
jgi:hypothetical protein